MKLIFRRLGCVCDLLGFLPVPDRARPTCHPSCLRPCPSPAASRLPADHRHPQLAATRPTAIPPAQPTRPTSAIPRPRVPTGAHRHGPTRPHHHAHRVLRSPGRARWSFPVIGVGHAANRAAPSAALGRTGWHRGRAASVRAPAPGWAHLVPVLEPTRRRARRAHWMGTDRGPHPASRGPARHDHCSFRGPGAGSRQVCLTSPPPPARSPRRNRPRASRSVCGRKRSSGSPSSDAPLSRACSWSRARNRASPRAP
jgi:hypothetical protein